MDQAKKLVEEKRLPEDFLSTADDLDNIAQKYKDEIRNQTVRQIVCSIKVILYYFNRLVAVHSKNCTVTYID